MKGQTATRKQLAALEKQFKLSEDQSIIDIESGYAIVFDRVHEKFTVVPPDIEFRESPGGMFSRQHWTKHIATAYRLAREAGGQSSKKTPVLVVYKHRHSPQYGYGYATFEAGRLVIRNPSTGRRVGSNVKGAGGATFIKHWYDIHIWKGTLAQAKKFVESANKVHEAHKRAIREIEKLQGRQLSYLDDLALYQAGAEADPKNETDEPETDVA